MVRSMDLYSASAVDLAIIERLFDFQEIRDCPSRMQNPDVDILVELHPAQSLSH